MNDKTKKAKNISAASNKPLNSDEENDNETSITPEELALLDAAEEDDINGDDESLREAELDNTDEDGDPLNENTDDVSGDDLDVPGADADNADEEIGEEDEENNDYSGADEENE